MKPIVLACLVLTACGEKADDRICSTPPSANIPGDWLACAHKWAYRLAVSKESVETVANAVTIACQDVADHAATGRTPEEKAQAYVELLEYTRKQARWRTVQARAGHCEVP